MFDVGKRGFRQELGFVTLHRRALSWTGEVQVYLCNEVCLQGFEVNIGLDWGTSSLGWGMFAGRGKFSGNEFLFAMPACGLVCASLRFGRGTWCSPRSCVGLTVGETPTRARTRGSSVGKETPNRFLSFRGEGGGGWWWSLWEWSPVRACYRMFLWNQVPICSYPLRCCNCCKWFVSNRVCLQCSVCCVGCHGVCVLCICLVWDVHSL